MSNTKERVNDTKERVNDTKERVNDTKERVNDTKERRRQSPLEQHREQTGEPAGTARQEREREADEHRDLDEHERHVDDVPLEHDGGVEREHRGHDERGGELALRGAQQIGEMRLEAREEAEHEAEYDVGEGVGQHEAGGVDERCEQPRHGIEEEQRAEQHRDGERDDALAETHPEELEVVLLLLEHAVVADGEAVRGPRALGVEGLLQWIATVAKHWAPIFYFF